MKGHSAKSADDRILTGLIADRNETGMMICSLYLNTHLISLALTFPFYPSHSVPLPPVRNTLQAPYP